MAVEWREHLSVGVQRIDDQHKELFRRFGALMDAINEGKGAVSVLEMLAFLDDYTGTHFRDEEQLQQRYNYPHLALHREEHAQFRRDLDRLKGRVVEEGFTPQNVLLTSRTLLRWLVQHICSTDKALAEFINSRGKRVIPVPPPSTPVIPKRPEPKPDPNEKEFPFYYEDDVTS